MFIIICEITNQLDLPLFLIPYTGTQLMLFYFSSYIYRLGNGALSCTLRETFQPTGVVLRIKRYSHLRSQFAVGFCMLCYYSSDNHLVVFCPQSTQSKSTPSGLWRVSELNRDLSSLWWGGGVSGYSTLGFRYHGHIVYTTQLKCTLINGLEHLASGCFHIWVG